ncbi:YqgE/AlgH family protein [soil metagenome]
MGSRTGFQRLACWLASLSMLAAPVAQAGRTIDPVPDADTTAVILVATDILIDPVYNHTVIVVRPAGNGMHVGVILNRPTGTSLASLFPSHEPSRNVKENVFFGGPMAQLAVAAVTRNEPSPLDGVLEFKPDLYLVLQAKTIDSIIETAPNTARYYMGNVIWKPGELDSELEKGLWHVLPASSDLVFRKNTESLWSELDDNSRLLSAQADLPARRLLAVALAQPAAALPAQMPR